MNDYYSSPNDPSFLPYNIEDHYGELVASHGTGTGFSEGSPSTGYPDQMPELCPYSFGFSSSSSVPVHATGLSEPGNPSRAQRNVCSSEDLQSNWNYHSSHARPDLSFKTVSNPNLSYSPAIVSPTATLPTPSEMAVLLTPDNRPPLPTPMIPPAPLAIVSGESSCLPPEEEFMLAKERKHACSMCHKRSV